MYLKDIKVELSQKNNLHVKMTGIVGEKTKAIKTVIIPTFILKLYQKKI